MTDGSIRRSDGVNARISAENSAGTSLVQLLCAISMLRTGLTQVLPLAGCAAWWTLPVAMLPGAAACLLAWIAMRVTGAKTLPEMARSLAGRAGAVGLSLLLGALLLMDAAESLHALIVLFTDGVGSRGTPLTLALATCGALALCLWRDGLARGVQLLRWPLLAGCAAALAAVLPVWRVDHLYPMQGAGLASAGEALRAGAGLAWPLILLLTIPAQEGRRRPQLRAIAPIAGATAAMLALCLMHPQEAAPPMATLAQRLMLPWRYASPAVQLLMLCLLLMGLFLGVAAAVQLGGGQLCVPWGRRPAWLPGLLLAGLALTQAVDVRPWLTAAQGWLLLPLAAACVTAPVFAAMRRTRKNG